jgi:CheY-like chemotaxis protein
LVLCGRAGMMTWLRGLSRRKVVCFVDDDEAELSRFRRALEGKQGICCATGTGYDACMRELKEKKLRPDLWVLDLYHPTGRDSTKAERDQMAVWFAELEKSMHIFRGRLATIGQGPQGGLDLLESCRKHRVPIVMFTRKGNLEDGLTCIDRGAIAVLKKPMPAELGQTPEDRTSQLDRAMEDKGDYLAGKLRKMIDENVWWYKHRGKLIFLGTQGINAFLFCLRYLFY